MASSRKNRKTMRGGAGKRVYLGNGDIAVCDCKGAGGRRFSANNIGMGAMTMPAFEDKKGRKAAAKTKRVPSEKAKSWQAEIARAFQNLRNANPAATRMNAMREAKTRRVAGTVPANLGTVAANIMLNVGKNNGMTRKIQRAEKAAAAAAEKAEKVAVAAAVKAAKEQEKVAKAQAAANAKTAKEQEKAAIKMARNSAAREKAEGVAAAAAARLAALQAKLMGK